MSVRICRSGAVPFLALASLALAWPAAAEQPLPTIPVPADPPPAVAREHDIETIVVTGELLTREAQRTTSSVAVHSGEDIERSGARDVYQVISATPNASLDDNDYGFGAMTLRGINGYGASGAGGFAVYSTTSTVVLDGVGLPRSALSNVDLSAFDLASVQILRGPQSTGQGRNAMAGAVIVDTIEPGIGSALEPVFRSRFAAGSDDSWQAAGALGATLWPDRLAVRLVTDHRGDGGDIVNATRDRDDWARRRNDATRLRAHFTPQGADGRYSAVLSAADLRLYQGSRYVLASQERARIALSNAPQDYDNDTQLVSLQQRLQLTDAWRLRLISAYIRSDTVSRFDLDYGAEDQGSTLQSEVARAHSQELRLDYEGDWLRGSIGAYWFDGRDGDVVHTRLDSSLYTGISLGTVLSDSESPARVEDFALFGEFDWSLTSRLTLTTGLRYDRERNGRTLTTALRGDNPALHALIQGLQLIQVLPRNETTQVAREFSEVLPKLALSFELFDGWFLGAAYAEGYRPGGDGYNQVSGRRFSFDSERTRNVELSFKGHHAPWHLWTALNLFGTRWEDMQVQGGQGVDTYLENAGLAEVRGGELELRWQPWPALGVGLAYGVTHGRFKEFVTTEQVDLAGKKLPKAPAASAALALEWSPWPQLLIRPEWLWTGATPANPDNRPEHELAEHHLLNLSLRWQPGEHVTLFLVGSNLTDERYRRDANDFSQFGIDVVSLGDRRRIFGGLEFEF